MSHDTLSNEIDARIARARVRAEQAMTAAKAACHQAAATMAEANQHASQAHLSTASHGQPDTRTMVERVRAEALAQGRALADALTAQGAEITDAGRSLRQPPAADR